MAEQNLQRIRHTDQLIFDKDNNLVGVKNPKGNGSDFLPVRYVNGSLVSDAGKTLFAIGQPGDWMQQSGGVVQSAAAISTTVQATLVIPIATTRVRIAWQNSGSAGSLSGSERLYIGANEANAVAGLLAGQDAKRRLYELAPGGAVVLLSSAPISTLHFSANGTVAINTHSIDVSYEQVSA